MIDSAMFAVIALALAVVVYVELRMRSVKKATGVEPGFVQEFRDLISGLRNKVTTVQGTVDATHAAVTAPTVQPAGFVLSEGVGGGGGGASNASGQVVTVIGAGGGALPKGFVLSEDAKPRIEDLEGPKIADWVSVNNPEMMSSISRIIHWWAMHPDADPVPGTGYAQSVNAIRTHQDLTGDALANAQAQDGRNFDNTQSGKYFDGSFPIAGVSLFDMYYLGRKMAEYKFVTGRDIYKDILYGSVDAVNAKIQEAGELHAAEMQAFDVSAYHGPMEAIVTNRMNGL